MTWTHFWDMNSGGGRKHDVAHIYIEAPEAEAIAVFYARYGHNPERVSCTCCGQDYAIDEYDSLEEATEYQRAKRDYDFDGERWDYMEKTVPLEEYIASREAWFIRAEAITADERSTKVPRQGYVWVD